MCYGGSFRNYIIRHRVPLADCFCISVSEGALQHQTLQLQVSVCPLWARGWSHTIPPIGTTEVSKSSSSPHSCWEQWQNKVLQLAMAKYSPPACLQEPMLSSLKDSRSSCPFPFSPGQAVCDLTDRTLSWAFLAWICARQQLGSEVQVRCFFPGAALWFFPSRKQTRQQFPLFWGKQKVESREE